MVGDEDYKERISIPYLTPGGVVSMRYRVIGDASPKYLGRHGESPRPYNVGALESNSPTIYLTEGELDAIMATSIGLPAVGIPGTDTWKNMFARLFRFRRVVVLADGDEPGKKFAEKVALHIDGCKIISMPPKDDVNSTLQRLGPEGLRDLIGIN